MSWHCSWEQEAEFSVADYLATELSPVAKSTITADVLSCNDNEMERLTDFRSGMTFKHSTVGHSAATPTSSVQDSHARTFQSQARGGGLMESVQDCGEILQESSVRYCPHSFGWKTHQCLFDVDLPESSVTLPNWGSMHDGVVSVQTPPDFHITAPEFGFLPTPRACIATHGLCWKRAEDGTPRGNLEDYLAFLYLKNGGSRVSGMSLHPSLCCLMMGWPIGWDALDPLEMDKYRSWQQSHGGFLQRVFCGDNE